MILRLWTSLIAFIPLLAPVVRGHAQTVAAAKASASHSAKDGGESGDQSIRLFRINVSQDVLTDLKRRLALTRWPEQETYGIEDSPAGLAAWMLDHDASSLAVIDRVFSGHSEGLTRDDILDDITLYWLTKTAVSFFVPKGVPVPTSVSVFPDEIYAAPKSWTEKAYPKLTYYNRLPKGGHFAAWEQPESFITELRAAFRSLRPTNSRGHS